MEATAPHKLYRNTGTAESPVWTPVADIVDAKLGPATVTEPKPKPARRLIRTVPLVSALLSLSTRMRPTSLFAPGAPRAQCPKCKKPFPPGRLAGVCPQCREKPA